jgi:long-subunit fatty acid transport protein
VITGYNGAIKNIQLQYGDQMLPASNVLGGLISTMSGGTIDQTSAATMASGLVGDKELDCSQSDMGYTPVLSAHYRTGKFDFAARYEFKTRLRLKNDTETNSTGISQFDDGKSVAADIPAMLALGVQYSIIPSLRFNVGGNLNFDKQSSQYNSATGKNDKQDYLKNNPWEFMAGLEYDINKIFTVSGGVNTTTFGFGKSANYISDMSFTTNSCSVGLGGRIHINDRMSFDLAVFRTFYSHLTKSSADYAGVGATYYKRLSPMAALMPALAANLTEDKLKTPGSDNFYRKSFVMGIGFNIDF